MSTRVLATIGHRLYGNFLMPDRLTTYEAMLEAALARGYEVCSVATFWSALQAGLEPGRRYLVLRHDVDTDPETAGLMWRIGRQMGVRGSFYFRLSTLDHRLMAEIAEGGGEASYHYEELATVAKLRGLKTRDAVMSAMPAIRARFLENLQHLRAATGLPMTIVASHGDFANRRLGIPNRELLADAGFRREAGIELEVYDAPINAAIERRFADSFYPDQWSPGPPMAALHANARVIYVLMHPRHWRVSPLENAREDLVRLWEGVRYALA